MLQWKEGAAELEKREKYSRCKVLRCRLCIGTLCTHGVLNFSILGCRDRVCSIAEQLDIRESMFDMSVIFPPSSYYMLGAHRDMLLNLRPEARGMNYSRSK